MDKIHHAHQDAVGNTNISLPPVIFGTSGLGNLFVALDESEKLNIVSECVRLSGGKVVFDSAGKYGAGLALETLGKCLERLKVPAEKVVISNKLGWIRTELKTEEPTFEPGVWKDLKHDAIQKIGYDGIMECFEQGLEFLNGYKSQMVSVHDPDEYIAAAANNREAELRYDDIIEAYSALFELKRTGKAESVGVGAKDWRIVKRISEDVDLDWIMIANSMTIKQHPKDLLQFLSDMERRGVYVINSAVFHSGFLLGSDYFDYRRVERGTPESDLLFEWRDHFFKVCSDYDVSPAVACVQFALNVPGVKSIALSTTNSRRVESNLAMAHAHVPPQFWQELKKRNLVDMIFAS